MLLERFRPQISALVGSRLRNPFSFDAVEREGYSQLGRCQKNILNAIWTSRSGAALTI
jgi:hypothetical protein